MVAAVGATLKHLAQNNNLTTLDGILASHPRLGEKKVESALSRAEQAAMAKASAGTGDARREQEILGELNAKYEETFPGLRYV
jgi:2-oxo-4-hydroxy-4-carboxy--5-ureidoimidazoline (OHCU) decarboxylase